MRRHGYQVLVLETIIGCSFHALDLTEIITLLVVFVGMETLGCFRGLESPCTPVLACVSCHVKQPRPPLDDTT